MLMNLKAGTEAMRAMTGKLMYLIDVAQFDPDDAERERAGQQVELLTPLIKAYSSDFGYLLIRDAIQILGGWAFAANSRWNSMPVISRLSPYGKGPPTSSPLTLWAENSAWRADRSSVTGSRRS